MNLVFKLFRLQQVDSQLDQIRARLLEIEHQLANQSALLQARTDADSTSQRLDKIKKNLRTAEENTRAQRLKIEHSETALYSGKVKNPKELQDLQNESAALKRFLAVLEERQLEAMLAQDEAQEAQLEAQAKLDRVEAQTMEEQAGLKGEKTVLESDMKRHIEARQTAVDSLPQNQVEMYEKLRQQRAGLAVARVIENACSACGSTLNAVLLQEARSSTATALCDTCGRILYAG